MKTIRIQSPLLKLAPVLMALVMAAKLLGWCLAISRIPQLVGASVTTWTDSPLVYLLIVNLLLLFVGCFMEGIAAMLILIPILVPVAMKLGIDPVHFGLVFVLNLMIGTVTPPVGVVLNGVIWPEFAYPAQEFPV